MDAHVKSVHTDPRSKKRIRFQSSRQRSKRASADVYRSYKRRIGVTSAASREERVHHPHREESRAKKRQRTTNTSGSGERAVVLASDPNKKQDDRDDRPIAVAKTTKEAEVDYHDSLLQDATEASLSEELDLALDRNASEIFGQLHRELWPLVRSLPEILHHASIIVDILLDYLLSPASTPYKKSSLHKSIKDSRRQHQSAKRERFVINHATTDILHLLAVLARDLRHEIHPHVHVKIIPRIFTDLLNPPNPVAAEDSPSTEKQIQPLDVSIVEAAFRSISYVFRYDSDMLVAEVDEQPSGDRQEDPCLEKLRQYYGATLAHRRDVVRRLAAETFAPLVRKLPNDAARKRHLRRVLRALAASCQKQQASTNSALKLQSNAIDGIAMLFFEVARGVSGRLHTKGRLATNVLLEFLCNSKNDNHVRPSQSMDDRYDGVPKNGRDIVFSVASAYVDHVCRHLDRKHFGEILDDLFSSTQRGINAIDKGEKQPDFGAAQYMMQLIDEVVAFRESFLLKPSKVVLKEDFRSRFLKMVLLVLDTLVPLFAALPGRTRSATLRLLSSTWKAVSNDTKFASHCRGHIKEMLENMPDVSFENVSERERHPAYVLADEIIPFLPINIAMSNIGVSVLTAAASFAESDVDLTLSLVLSTAKPPHVDEPENPETNDNEGILFALDSASHCSIASSVQLKLLDACLLEFDEDNLSQPLVARLGVAARSVSFLALVGEAREDETVFSCCCDRVSKWLLQVFKACADNSENLDRMDKRDTTVAASLALESLARLSIHVGNRDHGVAAVKKNLLQALDSAPKLLLSQPTSLWVLKAIAAFAEALKAIEEVLPARDEIFDALVTNLRDRAHFRRLYSLQILASFPMKPFVTDHADLDLTDDLDEEPASRPADLPYRTSVVRAGLCDIIQTLLEIESTEISLHNERKLGTYISRVEILGRTGKLPVVYAEAAANHMTGILYVKFSPIWPRAVRAIVSLVQNHDDSVWPGLQENLAGMMNQIPTGGSGEITISDFNEASDLLRHHMRCLLWEKSNGAAATLYYQDISKHLPTDEATVLEFVWSVLEGAPEIMAKHSRTVVPIFLRFMHMQYYAYYIHDPDARELRLEEHVEESSRFDRDKLRGNIIQRRLTSILKTFAKVKGAKHLFKHKLLHSLFSALLSHQDTTIAQLAFSCVLTYKSPCLMPYSEKIESLYAKGGLKEGLLQLMTSLESTDLDVEIRRSLTPLVIRVLFGRLSARATAGRSSKDTPEARRSAVLSFVSVFCTDDEGIYPFVYLMLRNCVPAACVLNPVEKHTSETKSEVLTNLKVVTPGDLDHLPSQVHIGLLHLLETVVANLGHRVVQYVPQFISIIVALCKVSEVKSGQQHPVVLNNDDEEKQQGNAPEMGSIRTLCFRRLGQIFTQFASAVDFTTYASSMWDAIGGSVGMLPSTVVNSERVPAILSLLQALSSHPRLVPLLTEHEGAIPCAIRCIARTSSQAVIDSTLTFIENLLSEDMQRQGPKTSGKEIVRQHVDLILQQFMLRLSNDTGERPSEEPPHNETACKLQVRPATWRRELRILCQISEIIDYDENIVNGEARVAERLFAVLLPFLEQGRGMTEDDQLNVIQILNALVPCVGPEAVVPHYATFARLLGPTKARPGIGSVQVRQAIGRIITKLAPKYSAEAEKVSNVLESICMSHPKRVDEIDYDNVIPSIQGLSVSDGDSNWLALATVNQGVYPTQFDVKALSPLIYSCFHLLHDDDGVISRGAHRALKTLISSAATLSTIAQRDCVDRNNEWLMLLERSIVPAVRAALNARNITVRRLAILLIAEVVRCCRVFSQPNLYGDLAVLLRDDDEDLDFFLNITHVQVHRRTRALQRLRKLLQSGCGTTDSEVDMTTQQCTFTLQSLSNILLPIVVHPIYESKTKGEESFVAEAIATVGAISGQLSWSKYNSLLWTTLTQFHRHPEQERYLIGMICAVIDGFHFDLSKTNQDATCELSEIERRKSTGEGESGVVWRALDRRFIPKIAGLLTKEKVDQSGSKVKTLRSSLVLALAKLFKKISKHTFESRLPRLLSVICDALKSRESDSRDVARNTLAKMVVEVDIAYLADVLREMAVTLREGYQLHVRSATVHTILLSVSTHYAPPVECTNAEALALPFDKCVPALMDLIQQDLFGTAQERRDAEGVVGRYVKEAAGSKSFNTLELIASLVLFRPSLANSAERDSNQPFVSGVHGLVSPLIERLRLPDVQTSTIRRIKECLSRVVSGLSRNPSVIVEEVLPFVYATAAPFIGVPEAKGISWNDDDSSDEEETAKAIRVSGSVMRGVDQFNPVMAKNGNPTVAEWRPSTLNSAKTSKAAMAARTKEEQHLRRVQDGAAAPKMTGSSRYSFSNAAVTSRMNDPSTVSAVVFSLRLLYSALKKKKITQEEKFSAMIDPFVPLLTTCVCGCRETDVVLLSLRCLGLFLFRNLPSKVLCAAPLGSKTLELLGSSGVGSNQNDELTQCCFKMLTLLINVDHGGTFTEINPGLGEAALARSGAMPLDSEQMRVLISFLRESVVESDHHNPALGLIKAIISRRYVSPEFYDMMDTMLDLTARSSKASLRQQSSSIFINYLLSYPMGSDRSEQHLKQIVLNVKYEHEEGRLSAINLATMIVEKVPEPVLDQHAQVFFLPLTLQLANDDSKQCREAVGNCLTLLLRRASTDVVQSLYDFACRWSKGSGDIQRTSLQLFGIFVDARTDIMKRGETAAQLVDRLTHVLEQNGVDEAEWEVFYFALVCLEKLFKHFAAFLAGRFDMWTTITQKGLIHSHPFAKLVSSRLIHQHLESMDASSFAEIGANTVTFLAARPGSLYEIARNLCYQLNVDEGQQNDDMVALCIKSLTWILPAMKQYPQLCQSDKDKDDYNISDEERSNGVRPVAWVMTRLSNIAKPKGTKRRQSVFKAFAAFATFCGDTVMPHLELMITPLHRADIEASSSNKPTTGSGPEADPSAEATLARDVLHLLEEKSDPPEAFLRAYAAVKTRAREKKDARKLLEKSEVIRDPQLAAKHRQEKNEKEKKRRKRRVDDRRRERGGIKKHRHGL